MSAVTTLPTHRDVTIDDLAAMPDDGRRHELIDGTLLVSPSPRPVHQRVVGRLWRILDDACPAGLEAFVAPLDVRLGDDTLVRPDLLVVRQAEVGETGVATPPVLAVEILSPSTRLVDLNLKKARYEIAGCPSYWCVDPGDSDEPAWITAWDLVDGSYVQAGHAAGDETVRLERPFAVEVTPNDLVEAPRTA